MKDSTYQVACRPLARPGTDCGHSVTDVPVDVGDLRGSGRTVYFVAVPERLSKISGCRLPVSETDPGHCGPGGGFSATWSVARSVLRFAQVRMSCACDIWSIKPWRKIA